MRKVIVIAPIGKTGGVELLHQFAFHLAENYENVYLKYTQNNYEGTYKFYEEYTKKIRVSNKISHNDILIIPETMPYMLRRYKQNLKFFWWMSVDNLYGTLNLKNMIATKRFPIFSIKSLIRQDNTKHMVQSFYAKKHLKDVYEIFDTLDMTDYINEDFSIKFQKHVTDYDLRDNVILYNPSKGGEEQLQLINLLSQKFKFLPLVGLTREKMGELMGKSKVYLDLGNHPGKDRIPREAALMGCSIITNTRGSAGNKFDIPIDKKFKINQYSDNNLKHFSETIDYLFSLRTNDVHYSDYRKKILDEKTVFQNEVLKFKMEWLQETYGS